MTQTPPLPPGMSVLERGWLSANQVLFQDAQGTALVDSGYCTHSDQTLALVCAALGPRPLDRLLNTHLHSDHCGGNAALQKHYPALLTLIPPGEADAVQAWDESRLSYQRTGQRCPRFKVDGVLQAGQDLHLGDLPWRVLAAPGHDPHALLLYQPEHRTLISGDALWENGFGVVFPELEGQSAYDEVESTLDLIAELQPCWVVPGHGALFGGSVAVVQAALDRARSRLRQFREAPGQHARYAAKVLLKFKLMEWQRVPLPDFLQWAEQTPYVRGLHDALNAEQRPLRDWVLTLLQALQKSGAARLDQDWLIDA